MNRESEALLPTGVAGSEPDVRHAFFLGSLAFWLCACS